MTKSCDTCKFFALSEKYAGSNLAVQPDEYELKMRLYGTCRRRSPYHNGWPVTWGIYWCGKWKKGKRKKAVK